MGNPGGTPAQPGYVYLVGAGPGDPGLLTLRAVHLLSTATVILPDDLVSEDVLTLVNPGAIVIPVGKRCGQPRITQAGIHELLLHHARAGASVLRLKSGDPLVFGRASEEIAALRQAGLPFEIIPGITTAFAVAAALQTPLTDRDSASRLILATAHHAAGKPSALDWQGLFPPDSTPHTSLAIYMPGRDFSTISCSLVAAGLPPDTPVAAVSRASTPHQHVTHTTLAELPKAQPGPSPLLLLIGQSLASPEQPADLHRHSP